MNYEPVGVVRLNPRVELFIERGAEVTFVPVGICGEGDVTSARAEELVHIPLGIKLEAFAGNVVIIRRFRLQQDSFFVGAFEVFGERTVGMEPHVVESGVLIGRHVRAESVAVGRLDEIDLIVVVVAPSAEEVGLAVENEFVAFDFKFAYAKTFRPAVNRFSGRVFENDVGNIEVRGFGRPQLAVLNWDADAERFGESEFALGEFAGNLRFSDRFARGRFNCNFY